MTTATVLGATGAGLTATVVTRANAGVSGSTHDWVVAHAAAAVGGATSVTLANAVGRAAAFSGGAIVFGITSATGSLLANAVTRPQIKLPTFSTPFVDVQTGQISRVWLYFLISLVDKIQE